MFNVLLCFPTCTLFTDQAVGDDWILTFWDLVWHRDVCHLMVGLIPSVKKVQFLDSWSLGLHLSASLPEKSTVEIRGETGTSVSVPQTLRNIASHLNVRAFCLVKHSTICRIKPYRGLLELTSPPKKLALLVCNKTQSQAVSSNLGNGAFVSGAGGWAAVFTATST